MGQTWRLEDNERVANGFHDFAGISAQQSRGLSLSYERNIVIKELDGQLRLFVDLSDHVIGLNILRGCYEQSEISFVRQVVKPGQTVLDIGANIGYFAINMASLVGPSGRVYAFEPFDQNSDLLERSIAENRFGNTVILERAAVGRSSGSATLVFLELERGAQNSGGAYLFREGMEIPDELGMRTVRMIALDDYICRHPVSFIKIDIEGAEPLAFRGAEKLLKADRPVILSEINPVALNNVSGCTPAQFITEMRARGYDCHILEDDGVAGKIVDLKGRIVASAVFLPRAD